MNQKAFIFKILTLGLLALQVRCAPPSGFESKPYTPENTTGFTNPKGAPYTAGGDARVIETRQNQAALNIVISDDDKKLAEKITSVRFVRVNKENKIDRFGTKEVRLELELNGTQKIGFQGPLNSNGAYRFNSAVLVSGSLQVEISFEDEASQKYSSGRIVVKSLDERKRPLSNIEILLRSYAAATTTTLSSEQKLNTVNQRLVQLLEQRAFAWVANLVIPNGRSFYEVNLFASSPQNSRDPVDAYAADRRLFAFAGEAVRVGDFTDAPAKLLQPGLMKPLSVELIGDAEDTDQRTFAILLEGDQKQNIDLAIKIEKPEAAAVPRLPPEPPKILKGLTGNSFLPVDYNNFNNISIQKMINDFELNYKNPGVQSWIKKYTTDGRKRADLIKALNYAQPFRPLVQNIFQSYGIAPPAALVTFIESKFFSGGKYELETNKGSPPKDMGSTATGPFQLLYSTAKDMKMQVFAHEKGVLPPAGDHRLYFVPSACGAAEHLQKSLDSIAKRDSTMALAAYYLGNSGVATKIHQALTGAKPQQKDKLQLIKKYNFMFMDVSSQHMLPEHVIEYVNKALALYFVTGNPDAYDFKWDPTVQTTLPPNKVLPPINEIRNPICRQSAMTLIKSGLIK